MNQDSVLHGFTTFPKPDIQILGLDGDSSVQDAKQIKIALKVAAEAFDNKCLALGIARSGERFFNGRGIDISLDFSRPIDFGDMRQVRGFHCHTSVVEMAVLSRGDKRYEVPVRSHSGSQSAGLTNPEILEKVVGTSIETQVHRLWEKVQQAGAP